MEVAETQTIEVGDCYLPLIEGRLRDRFVLFEGPRGTGKTRAILTHVLLQALAIPGSRWLLTRSTRSRLSNSVMVTLEEQVFPAFGMRVPGAADRTNRADYRLPNGSRLIPMGLDDIQRTQSVEVCGIYVAEAVELSTIEEVTALAGAMRQVVPGHRPPYQCIVDCNPGPPGHWLNQVAEDIPRQWRRVTCEADYQRLLDHAERPAPPGRWKRIVTRHQDNPAYWDFECWDWTEQGRNYLAGLGYLTGHLRRRWLDGDWVAAEGVVYREFTDEKHVREPFAIPRDWPAWLAEDPGYDHPTAIVVAAMAPNGRLYLAAEHCVRETTVAQDAEHIKRSFMPNFNIRKMLGDPHYMFSKNKHNSGESVAMQMAKHGLNFVPAPAAANQSEIAQQVEMVRSLLTTTLDDGLPMLQVFRSCPNTIRGFQGWGYKRTAKGDVPGGEDKFEDVADDEMDCVRMLVASQPRFAQGQATAERL